MFENTATTVTPASYKRVSLAAYDAVTMWSPEHGYVTVNAPETAFWPSTGGLTVKGLRGTDTTVKSDDSSACIVTAFKDGNIWTDWCGLSEDDLIAFVLVL
jgi:hypothetical protein